LQNFVFRLLVIMACVWPITSSVCFNFTKWLVAALLFSCPHQSTFIYPWWKCIHFGVHSWKAGFCAAISERNDADLKHGCFVDQAYQWSSRISLEWVQSSTLCPRFYLKCFSKLKF